MAELGNNPDDADLIVDSATARSGPSWLPLILVLLFIPLTSYLVTDLVVIPQLKEAFASSDGRSAGGGRRIGHDGSGSGNHQAIYYHDLDGIVVNVAGTLGTRYLRTSFRLAGSTPNVTSLLARSQAEVMDVVLATLSVRTMAELEDSGGRVALRSALIEGINNCLPEPVVEQLYFTEFVIQ